MIKEVIDEIAISEQKAEQMIKDANVNARQMAIEAESEAENLKKTFNEKLKTDIKNILSQATLDAQMQAEELNLRAQKQADTIIKSAEKNIIKAVEYLADILVKKYSDL